MHPQVPTELAVDVDVLCLDAGNTVIYLDHARLARLVQKAGHAATTELLIRTEGLAKRAAEEKKLLHLKWKEEALPGARGWGAMVASILHFAGVPEAALGGGLLSDLWRAHVEQNLWSLVPADLPPALDDLRRTGVRTVIVSNSEGMLEPLFAKLGITSSFDAIIDSGKVGVEKPDPRIFQIALERTGATADRAVHLGDVYATDTLGARAANIRTALIDPHGHFDGAHPDVLRVRDATEVARAIVSQRKGKP